MKAQELKTAKETDSMKEGMYDKITVAFSQNCCKRGIEAMNASRKENV